MNDEKKGYGIVIPAEWKASDFNGSLDDLFAWIVELDKKAFYRLADAGGIDLELLERAGYEYEGLSFVALNEFENYFKGNSEELAIMPQLMDRIANASSQNDFDYVLRLNDKSSGIIRQYYSENYANKLSLSAKAASIDSGFDREKELLRVFIEGLKDGNTSARLEVLEKYGLHFNAQKEYEQFTSKRELWDWDANDGEYSAEDAEEPAAVLELIELYRLLSSEESVVIQSPKVKARKLTLSKRATVMLTNLIQEEFPRLRNMFSAIDVASVKQGIEQLMEQDSIKNMKGEFAFIMAEHKTELNLFYYLAYNAISWQDPISMTDRYLLLFRLAQFLGYIPKSDNDDLESGFERKNIADIVKKSIKRQEDKDPNQEILRSYLR